ncbi:hypothetical protein EU527_02080 [Candidatus Thorarchaeota archaeon]|nr:MAG: hypothetical protein EU527_02080 [Candidatus Thorarchaeota archaeon]
MTCSKRNLLISVLSIFLVSSTGVLMLPNIIVDLSINPMDLLNKQYSTSSISDQVPLRRITLVAPDSGSYKDEFAYISAIPSSVFNFNHTQYISPLIYASGTTSAEWFVEDWVEYVAIDGGLSQAVAVGDFSESDLINLQYELGAKIYPRITGSSSADIAATIAVSEWRSSDTAVVAFSKDTFSPVTPTYGSAIYSFENQATSSTTFSGDVADSFNPSSITFTPPSWAGWMEGSFNWTGNEILTHELVDPNGIIMDYSVYSQVYFSRHPQYVESPVPLHFWLPVIDDGQWTMNITRNSIGSTSMACEVTYHPGFKRAITVPSNADWLNVTLTWDNSATDLNMALIDPLGRLAMWAPAGSILSSPGSEKIELPYPMAGDWTVIAAWIGASTERNNIQLSWVTTQLPTRIESYLESASNGAVLASLLNVPMLYVEEDQIPPKTEWALEKLGVNSIWLVDPTNIQQASLITDLAALALVTNLDDYTLVSNSIRTLSGNVDIVVSVPTGDNNEFFAPAAYSAAVHGSPIFSLCSGGNVITTRAQETWVPYLIGPEINNIYVVNQYENRAENGWYDERIPNKYSMMKSVDDFEDFLTTRGSYNSTAPQPVVIVAPVSLLPTSFDRSLQSAFQPGRIPAKTPSDASIFINRGLLHRYLFLTADSSDTALVSMYAYTDGATFIDNNLGYSRLYQIENSTDALESAGFEIEMHVGFSEVFAQLDSQVSMWTLSTHGTLTLLPRDPPDRPYGLGYFSLRTSDSPYGFEESISVRESPSDSDDLVNPVAFSSEVVNHVTKSTTDLEQAIGSIGSPIIILTACLLGGTEMPLMLMKHGAVAVTASPRTVYFQPAGMLSVLLTQALCEGYTIGEALSYGLSLTSSDYANPLVNRDPRDYANQQILFGDPSVRLYEPTSAPYVSTSNSKTENYGSHLPGRGVPSIAVLGASSYYSTILPALSVEFDYYESTNFSDFTQLLILRETVFIEQDTLDLFVSDITSNIGEISSYVRNGGILAILGVTEDTSWAPWPISFVNSESGSSVTFDDPAHPLLTTPNEMSTIMNYEGYFDELWENFTILATAATHPVIVTSAVGSGKIVFTTTHLNGTVRDTFIENILQWSAVPSILVKNLYLSQRIIWAGDKVTITIELTDLLGNPLDSTYLQVWLNSTSIEVAEVGSGQYAVLLAGNWTANNLGTYDIRLHASKNGYDTLDLTLQQFILVRPFPWLIIGILGGGIAVSIVGWVYMKHRSGEPISLRGDKSKERRSKGKSKEEKKRQEEQDGKFDPKEFFGV